MTPSLQFASLVYVKSIPLTLPVALAALLTSVAAIAGPDDTTVWPASPAGPETVYAPPGGLAATAEPAGPQLKWELTLGYASAFVYRGVDHSATPGNAPGSIEEGGGSSFQLAGRLTLDTGGPWRPFVELFSNYWDTDLASNWQEVRPTVGLQWQSKAVSISLGATSYVYPDRTGSNTNEVFVRVDADDGGVLGQEQPVLNPYVVIAYDVDVDGWYGELGISHDWAVPGTSLTVTPVARLAYTYRLDEAFIFETNRSGSGWQHADLGLQLTYGLNTLLNLQGSAGQWSVGGFIFRTSHLADSTLGDSLTWGGVNLTWKD